MALVEPCVCPESTGVKRMGPAFAVKVRSPAVSTVDSGRWLRPYEGPQ